MCDLSLISYFFFFNDTATTEIYTLSLHDALPIYSGPVPRRRVRRRHHVRRGARPGRKAGLLHRLAPDVAHAGDRRVVGGDHRDPSADGDGGVQRLGDRKSTRLNSSHLVISYAVFC